MKVFYSFNTLVVHVGRFAAHLSVLALELVIVFGSGATAAPGVVTGASSGQALIGRVLPGRVGEFVCELIEPKAERPGVLIECHGQRHTVVPVKDDPPVVSTLVLEDIRRHRVMAE
ncbi:MAG: hypothetical protein ACREIA_22870 [Opitutaceae bacterium]